MTLFEIESQYREKATIWRVFSELMLFAPLAGGHIFRWFAVNIPMDLGTGPGGTFTSDIDIIARLYNFPRSKDWFYRTWEVKVSLLCKDGTTRSLKIGKMRRTIVQLKAYRDFGSPEVSLLDIYLCEAGSMGHISRIASPVSTKLSELKGQPFGYQVLAFGHGKRENADFGLYTPGPALTTFQSAASEPARQPFSKLAEHIDNFYEEQQRPHKPFNQIVFCKECRRLQMVRMKEEHTCPACGSDLIAQI